jgi:pyridinium-3,5-bisthiocarboxylic acid mononucleotide nickel chelatase
MQKAYNRAVGLLSRPTVLPTTNDGLMRIAYLDCFSGISGDMFLGALIDAGVAPEMFLRAVEALDVGAKLQISRVNRSGITATKVDVIVNGERDLPRTSRTGVSDPHQHAHEHEHGYEHSHDHAHGHHQDSVHQNSGHQHGRGLVEIRNIIGKAAISESAKRIALDIFEKLGAAEAKIHNVPIEKIHFHEVGAVDALVDIICAAVGAEALGVDELICSPLNVGRGTVNCAHGTFPVPAPATVELLTGAPVFSSGLQAELVTPTGAAIVRTLATRFTSFPEMKIEKTGYGAGTRDFPGHANVLRITVGEAASKLAANTSQETVSVLEANLDDLNPQVFGYVMDRLFEAGALDVFGMPVQMKKNRPGTLLSVLAKPDATDKLTQIIFAETTTLGVRCRQENRRVLARKWQTVSTRFGDVRIKIATLNGAVSSYTPEYEDCRRIALEHRVPLKLVMQEAVQQYLQSAKQ